MSSSRQIIYFSFDGSEIALDDSGLVPLNPQIEFIYPILRYICSTSLNLCGLIRCFIEAKTKIIELSPVLKIPDTILDFQMLLRSALVGREILGSGKMKLVKLRTEMPSLPDTKFTISPMANKVMNPSSITGSSVLFCISLNDQCGSHEKVCFSQYPIPPYNQCAKIISSYENTYNIE